jgi:hypothetical protein
MIAHERFAEDEPHRAAAAAGTDAWVIGLRAPIGMSEAVPTDLLARYVDGWAEADPEKIMEAAAPGYGFDDPLVGAYSRLTLGRYFRLLEARFALPGAAAQRPSFRLRGPMDARPSSCGLLFWREAPSLGLAGISRIVVGARGVLAEGVAYDLNMASEHLRRAN